LDSTERAAAELPAVRYEGARRQVAMRASDWETFESRIPRSAHFRLRAAFKRFCAGCDNMPEQLFHRRPRDGHGRLEEFVADGVHVIGRRGTDEAIQTFFVIELRVTADAPPLAVVPVPAQSVLPLPVNQPQRGTER
jgi:hypothetical protein